MGIEQGVLEIAEPPVLLSNELLDGAGVGLDPTSAGEQLLPEAAPADVAAFDQAAAKIRDEGGIEAHKNRYGGDPAKCPFIGPMGAAGLKLVEKIEASASNPNRRTIAEILAEKRLQKQRDEPKTQEKPAATVTTRTAEQKVAEKPRPTITEQHRDAQVREQLAAEIKRSDTPQIIEKAPIEKPPAVPAIKIAQQPETARSQEVREVREIRAVRERLEDIRAEASTPAPVMPARQEKPAVLPVIELALPIVAPVNRAASAPEVVPMPIPAVIARKVEEIIYTHTEHESPTGFESSVAEVESEEAPESLPAVMPLPEILAPVYSETAELVLAGEVSQPQAELLYEEENSLPISAEHVEQLAAFEAIVSEWLAQESAATKAPTVSTEVVLGAEGVEGHDVLQPVAEFVIPTLRTAESNEGMVTVATEDAPEAVTLPALESMTMLEPQAKAQVMETLEEISQVLSETAVEATSPEKTEAVEKRLEVLCTELFELLGFTPDKSTIKAVVLDILAFSIQAGVPLSARMSPEELSNLGTHEYKVSIASALHDHFVQAVRQRTRQLVELGRYILAQLNAQVTNLAAVAVPA